MMSFLIWAPQRPQPLRRHLLLYVSGPIVFQLPSVLFSAQYIEERRDEKRGVLTTRSHSGGEISACEEVVISFWRKQQQDEPGGGENEEKGERSGVLGQTGLVSEPLHT